MIVKLWAGTRVWIAVATLLSTGSGVRADWAPNDAQQEALEAVNAIRTKLGLPLYKIDERLCRAAAAHSACIDGDIKMAHGEKPGMVGFTGATPADRAHAAGYPRGAGEVINFRLNSMGVTNTVRELFDAPYHRFFFLMRGPGDMGPGAYSRTLTIDYCTYLAEGTFVHPCDGELDVPVSWSKGEAPDPRSVGHLGRSIGYPICFHYESRPREEIVVSNASITDAKGHSVDVFVNSPANDPQLAGWISDAIILPTHPLTPNTTYTVKVSAKTKSGRDVSHEWKFTTGGREITDRRDSQAEDAMHISFAAEPAAGNSVTARVINLDREGQRAFAVKARNTRGDLLASGRIRVAPSSTGSLVLNAKEPIQSVVLVPEAKMAGKDPVTRILAVRFRH